MNDVKTDEPIEFDDIQKVEQTKTTLKPTTDAKKIRKQNKKLKENGCLACLVCCGVSFNCADLCESQLCLYVVVCFKKFKYLLTYRSQLLRDIWHFGTLFL